jgi:hypothetical protein
LVETALKDTDKFIRGMVRKWIMGHDMREFMHVNGKVTPDVFEDMVQHGHAVVAEIKQRVDPVGVGDWTAYLKSCLRYAFIKYEERDRHRRQSTDNIIDEVDGHNANDSPRLQLEAPDPFKELEARTDVERIIAKAALSDVECLVIELKYGFGRGELTGPLETYTSSKICGKSISWVRDRLFMAHTKMQLAVEK